MLEKPEDILAHISLDLELKLLRGKEKCKNDMVLKAEKTEKKLRNQRKIDDKRSKNATDPTAQATTSEGAASKDIFISSTESIPIVSAPEIGDKGVILAPQGLASSPTDSGDQHTPPIVSSSSSKSMEMETQLLLETLLDINEPMGRCVATPATSFTQELAVLTQASGSMSTRMQPLWERAAIHGSVSHKQQTCVDTPNVDFGSSSRPSGEDAVLKMMQNMMSQMTCMQSEMKKLTAMEMDTGK